jgi:hypothetical protein
MASPTRSRSRVCHVVDLHQSKELLFKILSILEAMECVMMGGCCCGAQTEAGKQTAIEILRARFAKGEIDKAEFEERRQMLSNATQETPVASANKAKGCC